MSPNRLRELELAPWRKITAWNRSPKSAIQNAQQQSSYARTAQTIQRSREIVFARERVCVRVRESVCEGEKKSVREIERWWQDERERLRFEQVTPALFGGGGSVEVNLRSEIGRFGLQGYLAHNKEPPPQRATTGP